VKCRPQRTFSLLYQLSELFKVKFLEIVFASSEKIN